MIIEAVTRVAHWRLLYATTTRMLGRLGARRLFYALPTQSRPAIPIRPGHWHNRQSIRTVMSTIPVPLDFSAGPLVWIDCEMTGLDHKKDKIMEIAVRSNFSVSQSDRDI